MRLHRLFHNGENFPVQHHRVSDSFATAEDALRRKIRTTDVQKEGVRPKISSVSIVNV